MAALQLCASRRKIQKEKGVTREQPLTSIISQQAKSDEHYALRGSTVRKVLDDELGMSRIQTSCTTQVYLNAVTLRDF